MQWSNEASKPTGLTQYKIHRCERMTFVNFLVLKTVSAFNWIWSLLIRELLIVNAVYNFNLNDVNDYTSHRLSFAFYSENLTAIIICNLD